MVLLLCFLVSFYLVVQEKSARVLMRSTKYFIYTSKSSEKLKVLAYLLGKPNAKATHGLENSLNQIAALNRSHTGYQI